MEVDFVFVAHAWRGTHPVFVATPNYSKDINKNKKNKKMVVALNHAKRIYKKRTTTCSEMDCLLYYCIWVRNSYNSYSFVVCGEGS